MNTITAFFLAVTLSFFSGGLIHIFLKPNISTLIMSFFCVTFAFFFLYLFFSNIFNLDFYLLFLLHFFCQSAFCFFYKNDDEKNEDIRKFLLLISIGCFGSVLFFYISKKELIANLLEYIFHKNIIFSSLFFIASMMLFFLTGLLSLKKFFNHPGKAG